jgi:hypothetical protein
MLVNRNEILSISSEKERNHFMAQIIFATKTFNNSLNQSLIGELRIIIVSDSHLIHFPNAIIKTRGNFTYSHKLTRLLQTPSQYSKSLTLVYRTWIPFHFPIPLGFNKKILMEGCEITKIPLVIFLIFPFNLTTIFNSIEYLVRNKSSIYQSERF